MGDVISIISNADIAAGEGRMTSQEQYGWYRLSTRVLDTVPTPGEGAVNDAVAALKTVAPPLKLGAAGRTQIGSDAWRAALKAVYRACEGAGAMLATEAFTGG